MPLSLSLSGWVTLPFQCQQCSLFFVPTMTTFDDDYIYKKTSNGSASDRSQVQSSTKIRLTSGEIEERGMAKQTYSRYLSKEEKGDPVWHFNSAAQRMATKKRLTFFFLSFFFESFLPFPFRISCLVCLCLGRKETDWQSDTHTQKVSSPDELIYIGTSSLSVCERDSSATERWREREREREMMDWMNVASCNELIAIVDIH